MAQSLLLNNWKVATREEVIDFLKPRNEAAKPKINSQLIVRSRLRPIDIYSYLRARFGIPNGFQNFLRADDSDNWIHWDFNLKSGAIDIYIAGTSRDIHFLISEKMTDENWKTLIQNFKVDFGRFGREKSNIVKSFEKFVTFQNKYVTLANLCAEMHETITNIAPARIVLPTVTTQKSLQRHASALKRLSKRASNLYGDCLKLRLITPIMAESFINLLILVLCKDEVRLDNARYDTFIRERLPERLYLLSINCHGFARPVDQTTEIYSGFKRVMDKRNFAVHGNIDPIREQIETVYFEGKRPLFADNGNNIVRHFEQLESVNEPGEVIKDYEAVHLFLLDILDCLNVRYRYFFEQIADDPYPGFEVNKKRVTKVLPPHTMTAMMPGMRYDDDLKVEW